MAKAKEKTIYWTAPQLAKEWGIGRGSVHYLIDRGLLKAIRFGMPSGRIHYRIKDSEKQRYEKENGK